MELRWPHIIHIYHVFLENDGSENCAQLIEEEFNKMFGTKSMNDEHDCNVAIINSLNIHDASDMQSHKLGDAIFDEDNIFTPPSFDNKTYYDESMPPIYDDYIDESGFGEVMTLFSDESNILEEVSIGYDKKLLSMMIIVMTCMLLRIKITMKLVIMILIFNWIMLHMIVIWLQGCLRETIFILCLPRIDKP